MPFLRVALIVLILGSFFTLAHLFRFTPIAGGDPLGYTPMWDRWFQRVCVVSFAGANQINCSMGTFADQFGTSKAAAPDPMTKIEQARQAGFSELEVMEWIEKELKTKRQQGMSDAEIAVDLFGNVSRKTSEKNHNAWMADHFIRQSMVSIRPSHVRLHSPCHVRSLTPSFSSERQFVIL